jgi:release factor glutamine methyltransferase
MELLAQVLGVSRGELPTVGTMSEAQHEQYAALLDRRAAREPLQHLTGRAPFRHVELAVGPGVFVPRPETELLAGWAVAAGRTMVSSVERPVVVDLGTGSGAIALAVATEAPATSVHAVEIDERAYAWASRNLAGTDVDLRLGDLVDAFRDLDGTVDVLVCNPPYLPLSDEPEVDPEVRDHDPAVALWSGQDGLDAIRALEPVAARLLRSGGALGVEHSDRQGESAPAVFRGTGRWRDVKDHPDLAGRPRYLTASLC